jgi:hypothetical protein
MFASKKRVMVLAALTLAVGSVFAGECVLQVTRTACPGKDTESFSKCAGKASCNETVPAASAGQCTLKAKSACANKRQDVTKNKKVSATFDGSPVEGGKDFCIDHADYPYASKPDCK